MRPLCVRVGVRLLICSARFMHWMCGTACLLPSLQLLDLVADAGLGDIGVTAIAAVVAPAASVAVSSTISPPLVAAILAARRS